MSSSVHRAAAPRRRSGTWQGGVLLIIAGSCLLGFWGWVQSGFHAAARPVTGTVIGPAPHGRKRQPLTSHLLVALPPGDPAAGGLSEVKVESLFPLPAGRQVRVLVNPQHLFPARLPGWRGTGEAVLLGSLVVLFGCGAVLFDLRRLRAG